MRPSRGGAQDGLSHSVHGCFRRTPRYDSWCRITSPPHDRTTKELPVAHHLGLAPPPHTRFEDEVRRFEDEIRSGVQSSAKDSHIEASLAVAESRSPDPGGNLFPGGSIAWGVASARLTPSERRKADRRYMRRMNVELKREALGYWKAASEEHQRAHVHLHEASRRWTWAGYAAHGAGRGIAPGCVNRALRGSARPRGAGRPRAQATRSSAASGDSGSDPDPPSKRPCPAVDCDRNHCTRLTCECPPCDCQCCAERTRHAQRPCHCPTCKRRVEAGS